LLITCDIHIQFAEYFYMLHPFKINFFSYFVPEISFLCHDQTIFNVTWISPLPEFFISSSKSQEATPILLSIRENYYRYTVYVKRKKKHEKCTKYWTVLGKIYLFWFSLNNEILNIFRHEQIYYVCAKWDVTLSIFTLFT